MNLYVGLSMLVVFSGTVFGSVPMNEGEMFSFADIESMLWYLAGIGAVIMSAFCQAGRLVFQEVSFVTNKRVSPLQLASLVALVSLALTSMMLGVAQFLPGYDNGVQVRACPAVSRAASSPLTVQASRGRRTQSTPSRRCIGAVMSSRFFP